jgi:hypothetical protein
MWDGIMSIDPLVQYFVWMVRFIKFLRKWYHWIALVTVFLSPRVEHVNTSHIHDLQNLCLVLVFLDLSLVFTIYVDMVCKYS